MSPDAAAFAQKYLEDILSFFGLNTAVEVHTDDEDNIELDIPSTHMNGFLIGQHGDVLQAIQSLVAGALINKQYSYGRLHVDVADYKKQRAEHLAEQARQWVKKVIETKQPYELKPMTAADRRIVHQVAAEAGLVSDSVGTGRDRHVIIQPTA